MWDRCLIDVDLKVFAIWVQYPVGVIQKWTGSWRKFLSNYNTSLQFTRKVLGVCQHIISICDKDIWACGSSSLQFVWKLSSMWQHFTSIYMWKRSSMWQHFTSICMWKHSSMWQHLTSNYMWKHSSAWQHFTSSCKKKSWQVAAHSFNLWENVWTWTSTSLRFGENVSACVTPYNLSHTWVRYPRFSGHEVQHPRFCGDLIGCTTWI